MPASRPMMNQPSASSLAEAIAAMAVRLVPADVPASVIERAKLHILDAIGLGLAASVQDFAASVVDGAVAMSEGGACTVIGRSEYLPPRDAALVNAVLIHGLDFDDTHPASIIHPTCTALPAALALGEWLGASGAEVLAAFLAGAETGIRLGLMVDGGFHHVGFHATGVVSHFASAVVAGRLLSLDVPAIIAAQGIAGSTASGIQVFLEDGAWTKRLHPGWGAAGGITAAFLARSGFKGPARPYEGRFGLLATHLQQHAGKAKLSAITDSLGEHWHFGETALKPYPVCHFIHGCADAAITLHREIGGAQILSVDAFLPDATLPIVAEPAETKMRPQTEYEAKFSAHFVVARCLLYGGFGLSDLLPEALTDPGTCALARKVSCHADPDSAFPAYFSGGVRVTLADGRRLFRHVRINSGAGDRAMTREAVVAKFMACARLAIGKDHAAAIADAALDLENREIRELTSLLSVTASWKGSRTDGS
ncbi:MAG: MmgE/PrpD family protein [Novosphingobium sp.]|nr:MmgE/PrpD family protein [Novosphingobium sp.]